MKVLLNLCLLFSLISPVLLLTCHSCTNTTGTECAKTESERCNVLNPSCRNHIFRSNVFFIKGHGKKYCLSAEICHPGHFSVTTSGGGFLEMLVECCKKDNCNSNTLKFSSEPTKPTRMECVGCHAEGKKREICLGTEVVRCHGDQTKCISMKMDYVKLNALGKTITFSVKGCATPQMCDGRKVKDNFHLQNMFITNISVKCNNALE